MLKIVSFAVFIAAFVWTWFLFNSHSKISLATHAGIQSKFMVLIEDSVKAAKPNSSNFEILNIYTEKIDDSQVRAKFSYKYTDQLESNEKVNQVMSGEAILARADQAAAPAGTDKWVVQSVKTGNSDIEFQQPMTIHPENTAAASGDPNLAMPEEKKTE